MTAEKDKIQKLEKVLQVFTVNHEYNFVNPTTGVHAQHIEKMLCYAKQHRK